MQLKICFHSHFVYQWSYIILFSLSFFKIEVTTLVPQASQEGSLHPFKSYSDVTIFHYTVPKEVYRATWHFAAFMDGRNCMPRRVHIYLQSGSYPVINHNNATFPPYMYPERNNTITVTVMTTYETDATVILPVNSPEPGDWFVGAYMDYWDEKVQQDGIGHKCRYNIGSVGIWLQANSIQSLPIGISKFIRTSQPSTYYKIFIPSGTWNFKVTISDCKSKVKISNERSNICIKALALEGRTLPIYNHTHLHSMISLTTNSTYSFTERTPYEDSYYYLLVVADSVVDFNVTVTTFECPVKIVESKFMNPWASNLSRNSLIGTQAVNKNPSDMNNDDICPRRFQLIRVKHLQTFSGVYLLQGSEWLTPWITLTDLYPVVAQFTVLPLVDVGGSLDIGVHLEMGEIITKQEIIIYTCVRRARVPDRVNGLIVCDNQHMMLNLSSVYKHDGHLMVPYPQPDTWHIALQVKCHFEGSIVPCDMDTILISLNVRTRQCVFSGSQSCGENGVCAEIHRGLLHFTSCSCFGGYQGWGCTDATNVNLRTTLLLTSLILILSNVFFLPAIYLAIKRNLYAEALVYFATMLFSSFYHACDQKAMTYCIAKYEVLQYSDFFSSILAFWVTLVAMAKLPLQLVSVCHMLGVIMIAFGVESNRTGLPSILVPLAIGIIIPIGAFIYRCHKSQMWRWPRGLLKLFIGLLLASIGLLLFATIETEANYQYIHSIWHILIALSLLFLLPSSTLKSSNSLVNDPNSSSSDSELLDFKDNFESPVFTISTSQECLAVETN